MQGNVGPIDLEQAVLKPQFSPLLCEIVTKLLAKNITKATANQKSAGSIEEDLPSYAMRGYGEPDQ